MDLKRLICALGLTVIVSGCSQSSSTAPDSLTASVLPTTLYDYTLHPSMTPATGKSDNNDTPLPTWTLAELVDTLQEADVILIGEWHGHPATHRLQADLLAALYAKRPHLTLSMEQFSRDKQYVLNQYLAGEIGEETLIHQPRLGPITAVTTARWSSLPSSSN
ncbi:uncharacterized iron-regulated protein [Photobacterium aphoticum]|uniref:Uncharacterized iron-regulated protein n=1 Tax=Photobacterium aphoticum TaxID=754436 RepID=A0A090QZ07_9GAMM|nr:uncharacterized iron-regulated protein [Photobacterium aphoticum]